METLYKIEQNLHHSAIPQHEKDRIYRRLHEYTEEELEVIWEHVKDNLMCPISSGRNYSQTDIKGKLNKEL